MSNEFLTGLLGPDAAKQAEEACKVAFVKAASDQGINLSEYPNEEVSQFYETQWRPGYEVALQKQAAQAQNPAQSTITKAAAAGASDEVLEGLAFAELKGQAMYDGFLKRGAEWEMKLAQEGMPPGAGGPPPGPEAPPGGMPPEAPPEGEPEAPPEPAEAAKEILEAASDEAVDAVAAQAPPETPPEALAQAAAEQIPAVLEQKVAEMVAWLDKNASDKEAATEYAGQVIDYLNEKLAAKPHAVPKPTLAPSTGWLARSPTGRRIGAAGASAADAARAVGRTVAAHPGKAGLAAAGALAAGGGIAALLRKREQKKAASYILQQKMAGGAEDPRATAAALVKAQLGLG